MAKFSSLEDIKNKMLNEDLRNCVNRYIISGNGDFVDKIMKNCNEE